MVRIWIFHGEGCGGKYWQAHRLIEMSQTNTILNTRQVNVSSCQHISLIEWGNATRTTKWWSHTIPFDLNIVLYFGYCSVYPSPIDGFWLSLWDILLYTYMHTYNEKQKVGTIPKSDRKIVKTEITLIPLTHTYMNISFLTLVHSFQ